MEKQLNKIIRLVKTGNPSTILQAVEVADVLGIKIPTNASKVGVLKILHKAKDEDSLLEASKIWEALTGQTLKTLKRDDLIRNIVADLPVIETQAHSIWLKTRGFGEYYMGDLPTKDELSFGQILDNHPKIKHPYFELNEATLKRFLSFFTHLGDPIKNFNPAYYIDTNRSNSVEYSDLIRPIVRDLWVEKNLGFNF